MGNNRLLEGMIKFKEGPPFTAAVGDASFESETNQLTAEVALSTKVGKQTGVIEFKVRPDTEIEKAMRALLAVIRAQVEKELKEE